MELGERIVQAETLTGSEGLFLGEDAADALLGSEPTVEERLAVPDALHHLHRQHVGTEQLQLVVAPGINMLQETKGLVVAHLLVGDEGHVVDGLCLAVVSPDGESLLCRRERGGDIGIAETIGHVVLLHSLRFLLADLRTSGEEGNEEEQGGLFHLAKRRMKGVGSLR